MTAKTLRLAHKLFLRYREFFRCGEEKICVRWRDCESVHLIEVYCLESIKMSTLAKHNLDTNSLDELDVYGPATGTGNRAAANDARYQLNERIAA